MRACQEEHEPRPLIGHGFFTNWNDLENIRHRTFYNELSAVPEEHPVFCTHTVLYVSGRTTGSVMDTSDGDWHIVPIYESLALHRAILRLVGRDPAEHPMNNLTEQGYSLTAAAEGESLLGMSEREKLCFMLLIATPCSHRPAENDKEKTYESQVETPSPAALNVSVKKKCYSCQVSH